MYEHCTYSILCREGEQTCDLLCLVSLLSLRKSLDIAAERKRGITDLDLICQEIELLDRLVQKIFCCIAA